jgi:thioredoxin reductase
MTHATNLLIIGAGPFGLALAAYAHQHAVNYRIVGKPMDFWKTHMPQDMYLRSGCDWHLDPGDVQTIEAYLATKQLRTSDVEPLPLDVYLDYTNWFQKQAAIAPLPHMVQQLEYANHTSNVFTATLDTGETITAKQVVLALGMQYFKHIPDEYTRLLPSGRYAHTCDLVDFEHLVGKRCLVIGGRQSAFEWAALLHEAGAAAVHLSYRHATPTFTTSDWSWVSPLVDAMLTDATWFRRLTPEQKTEVQQRLWAEGRLKLEPWLAQRVTNDRITLWPHSQVVACAEQADGSLNAQLDSGIRLAVDYVILATGYKVDIGRVPLLNNGNLLSHIETRNGYPVLDEQFQTSIPGLFFTSFTAGQDFGPFFGFTVGVRTAAKIIGRAVV